MEFWIRIVDLVRRKRVIIPVVLVALALGALAYFGTPTVYQSSSTMVLTTTEYGGTEFQDPANPIELTNPMLNFNDSLRTTSAILIQTMNTKDVAKQLGVHDPTQLFVNDGRTNPELLGLNGPFLYIVAKSQDPDEAKRVVAEAEKLMKQKLSDWQSALNAPDKTFVSIADVVPPGAAVPDRARATKLAVMSFGMGFLLSLGIAYFATQRLAQRRARATVRATVASAPPPSDRPEPDPNPPPPDDAEPNVIAALSAKDPAPADDPDSSAENTAPDDAPTSTNDKAEPAVVPAVPIKQVRSRPATTTKKTVPIKRSRPGPAITPKKARGRAAPTKHVTSVSAAPKDGRSRNP